MCLLLKPFPTSKQLRHRVEENGLNAQRDEQLGGGDQNRAKWRLNIGLNVEISVTFQHLLCS